ncbi:MAG: MFS transporter [Actinomycetota bacterium]
MFALEQATNEFVGPPLGGWLTGLGIAYSLTTGSVLFLVAAGLLAMLRGRYKLPRSVATTLRAEIITGVRFLYDNPLLRTTVVIVAVLNLVGMATQAVLPLYAVEPGPLGLTEFGYGSLLLGFGLGGLIGSTIAESLQRRFGRARVLVGAIAGSSAWMVALGLTRNVDVVAVTMVLADLRWSSRRRACGATRRWTPRRPTRPPRSRGMASRSPRRPEARPACSPT